MKKKTVLLMTIVMSIFILVGCTSKEEIYTQDQENLQKIADLSKLVEDTYSQVREVSSKDVVNEFKSYCDKILKEAKNIDIKTKEGKPIKKAYINKIEYSVDYLINNWNDTSKPLMYDSGLNDIDTNLSNLIGEFLIKKEKVIYEEVNESGKMEIVYFISGIIIGTALFVLLNNIVDIYYFGCSGIIITWGTCVGLSTYIASIIGELVMFVAGLSLIILLYKVMKNNSPNL